MNQSQVKYKKVGTKLYAVLPVPDVNESVTHKHIPSMMECMLTKIVMPKIKKYVVIDQPVEIVRVEIEDSSSGPRISYKLGMTSYDMLDLKKNNAELYLAIRFADGFLWSVSDESIGINYFESSTKAKTRCKELNESLTR